MTDFDPANFATVDPKEFAQLVKSTPDDKIAEVMQSDLRGQGPRRGLRPDAVAVPRRPGRHHQRGHPLDHHRPPRRRQRHLRGGHRRRRLHRHETPQHEPKLALTMGPVEFLKIVSGGGNPVMMFMTGKLKAKGDLGLAANIANLFDIPKA